MAFGTNNTERMRITSGGNVGIGTTDTQTFILAVDGPNVSQGDTTTTIRVFDTNSANTNTGGGISFAGYFSGTSSFVNTFSYIKGGKENSTAGDFAAFLSFGTRANGGAPTERMRITSGGIIKIANLAGTGTRLVAANADGDLVISTALSGYVPYTGATEGVNLGVYGLTATGLTVTKSSNVATISFPNPSGKNDPAYIQHDETTTNTGIMRFSVSDDDGTLDYFVFGNTAGTSGAYLERFKITSNGIVNLGTWQGSAIADAYISSAATWNAKQNQLNGTGFVKASGTTITYDNSTYLTTSSASSTYVPYSGANANVNLGSSYSMTASSFFESSDIRFKNVLETNPSISALGIDVIKFTRKGQSQVRYGYSAQQVKSVLPDAVFGDDELTVNYSDIHTLKIASLEKRVAELELRLKSTI
jgi:hypothetical protein